MTSEKSKTNKKWTSTEEFRANYDRIFSKRHEPSQCRYCSRQSIVQREDGLKVCKIHVNWYGGLGRKEDTHEG